MPLPFFAVAIPLIHSSGGWIASTAATGYIAGTLSGTWIGAFVLGNSTLLSSIGIVSGAGVLGASGGIAALSSGAATGLETALSAAGLGGVASALGIAPAVTFLGLTPIGWAATGTASTVAGLGYFFARRTMNRLNEERKHGGLEPITLHGIVKQARELELDSLTEILGQLDKELDNVSLSIDGKEVTIDGQVFSVQRLRYVVKKDGSEALTFVTRTGRQKRVLLVRPPESEGAHTALSAKVTAHSKSNIIKKYSLASVFRKRHDGEARE